MKMSISGIIINLVTSIINLIDAIITNTHGNQLSLGGRSQSSAVAVLIVIVVLLVVFFVFMLYFRKLANKRLISYREFSKFANLTKISYYKIHDLYINRQLTKQHLDDERANVIIGALDCLCNLFRSIVGCQVRSCIKILECDGKDVFDSSLRLTQDNARVVTLARSRNSENLPDDANKPKKVAENSDFFEILFGGKKCFYEGNLPKYKRILKKYGKDYLNTTEHWENYYKATIVVPICVDGDYISQRNESQMGGEKKYFINGFLCVDSMSTCAFKTRGSKANMTIVNTFADGLYTYLKYCRFYESGLYKCNIA